MSVKKSVKKSGKKKSRGRAGAVEMVRGSETEFTNRETGWLQFNRRVLFEAEDPRNPILERVRFLSISNSNLDEFFMKRVGALKRQVELGISSRSADGKTTGQQMIEIRKSVLQTIHEQARVLSKILKPSLKKENIHLLAWKEITDEEKAKLKTFYRKNIFPILTPLSVDIGHPFPFISNLSTSLGITLRHPGQEEKLFARVKIPQVLPQWIQTNPEVIDSYRFVSLIDVIAQNLTDLFPAMEVLGVMPFRITRNADMVVDEEDAEDLLQLIEEELRLRRFADVVRLEHGPKPDPWMLQFLMSELKLGAEDLYEIPDELDYSTLEILGQLDLPNLKFENWVPVVPQAFIEDESHIFFSQIRTKDHLVHHPYESFSSTVDRLLQVSARDPQVIAIKMTLYRTGENSPLIRSLIRAAGEGKQVVCLVELKARFDEEQNIYWAQELENAGVHVVYGIVGLKTHAKTALIVRQEEDGLRCYAHIGTGNYNVQTARFYTDLGLLTSREEITSELVEFFHYLTGRSLKTNYQHLLIAPLNMYSRFKTMIAREIENSVAGKPAGIFAKMNNFEENELAMLLYEASRKGVSIDMSIRGFCALRPGVPGMSDKIKVSSVIGRFLEHSRFYYFRNAAVDPLDGEFYIGSADWMHRNLHSRVECIVPIIDRSLREKLWELIQLYTKDQRQTWDMKPDGTYVQRNSTEGGVQQALMKLVRTHAVAVETEEHEEHHE